MKKLLLILLFALQPFAVTSGSYTVGSGGDYANWAAAAAATENLTGNLTFTQISDVTDNTALAFNVALGGYTLTLTSNKRHNGNFQSGWLTTLGMKLSSATSITVTNSSASAGAAFVIDGLNIKYTGTITNYGTGFNFLTATTNITNIVKNTLVDGNGKNWQVIRLGNANCVLNSFNCVFINGRHGIALVTAHATTKISNNTFYKMLSDASASSGFANVGNVAITINNVAAFECARNGFTITSSYTSGFGNATAQKCASSDTTGSEAGLINLTATDQFQSVTITDGDPFLKIKSTGVLDDGGVAPSIAANTTGIRGTARPHDVNKYSIGADEFKSTRPSVVITTSVATYSDNTPFTATVTFSESVTGLDSSEITATNCVKAGFSGSGAVYTYTITPTGTDDIVISAPENIAVDLYANGNTAATDKTITYVAPPTPSTATRKNRAAKNLLLLMR